MASSITDIEVKDQAFLAIARVLVKAGNMDKAIAFAMSIPVTEGEKLLSYISKALTQSNIERAITIATSISCEKKRGDALINISKVLMEAGNFDRATVIASLISDTVKGNLILEAISIASRKNGYIHKGLSLRD